MNGRRLAVVVLAAAAAVCVGATGQLALGARGAKPRAAGFPGGTYFVVNCSSTHRNNDDAIVFPGQPGRSHNHTYIGNRSADADSTPASLRANPANARCEPRTDASAYWFPTLYDGRAAVWPLVSIIYYVRRTVESVRPFPPGLKVIAGDARASRAQSARFVSWTCGPPVEGRRAYANVPSCSDDEVLHMNVNFPDCWDGRRLDSADHQSHMAYSSGGHCPASHRVALPAIRMFILYPAVPAGAQISSGRYTAHADFINAWDQDALAELIRRMNY